MTQARGFFFDLSPPTDDNKSDLEGQCSPHTSDGSISISGGRLNDFVSREWWEADTKHKSTGNKSTSAREQASTVRSSSFELKLPEHLPSSPLCPKNPKHSSGGTGICVYHGRRKSAALKKIKRASTDRTQDSGTTTESAQNTFLTKEM